LLYTNTVSQALLVILSAPVTPMQLARRLMGNLSDTDSVQKLAYLLNLMWKDETSYGPFCPETLMPEKFNFVFKNGK
jgi:hypothetical protein